MRYGLFRKLALAGFVPALLAGQTVVNGGRQITGSWDAGGAASTRPAKTGTSLPATCAVGDQYFRTDAAAGQNLFLCTAANTWTQISGGGGGGSSLPSMAGNANKVLSNDGAVADWRALGGDVSGGPGAVSVDRIRGQAVSAAAPANMQGLVFDGTAYAPVFVRPAFSMGLHAVDYFPGCISSASEIGSLRWQRGGANFTFGCASATGGRALTGITLTGNASAQYSASLSGLQSDYTSSSHSNKWTFEFEFTADASMATGSMELGLADSTGLGSHLGVAHSNGAGFSLLIGNKQFTDVIPWDTNRHIVRWERVSNSLIRARIDSGSWHNFHNTAGTDDATNKYGVSYPSVALRPQMYMQPGEAVAKSFTIHRFEMVYGY
jgi:hypothetical protein